MLAFREDNYLVFFFLCVRFSSILHLWRHYFGLECPWNIDFCFSSSSHICVSAWLLLLLLVLLLLLLPVLVLAVVAWWCSVVYQKKLIGWLSSIIRSSFGQTRVGLWCSRMEFKFSRPQLSLDIHYFRSFVVSSSNYISVTIGPCALASCLYPERQRRGAFTKITFISTLLSMWGPYLYACMIQVEARKISVRPRSVVPFGAHRLSARLRSAFKMAALKMPNKLII